MTNRLASYAFGAGVAATAYAFVFFAHPLLALAIAEGVVITLAIALILSSPRFARFDKANLIQFAVIAATLWLNVLANSEGYVGQDDLLQLAVLHVAGLTALLFALQWSAGVLDLAHVFKGVCVSLAPLIAIALAVALRNPQFQRATPFGIHPNWWGELAFAFAVCALAIESLLVRWTATAVALALIFVVQSRSGLLATSVALIAFGVFVGWPKIKNHPRLASITIVAIALAVATLLIMQSPLVAMGRFVASDVLLLDDPHRGLGTGLTGRIAVWREAMQIFANNPVLGSGIDTLASVHNGYLRLAGEGGAVLLLVMMTATVLAIWRAFKSRNQFALSALFGYLAYVAVQPRMLNMNVAAVAFFLALFARGGNRPTTPQLVDPKVVKAPDLGERPWLSA